MSLKYNDFINEDMATISRNKLRDAIHDIIVGLSKKEIIDVEKLSEILISDYKINISPYFLDKFLTDYMKVKRGDKKAKTIFNREDSKWFGLRDVNGNKEMRNNLLYLKPSLSKHKRKLYEDDEKQKLENAYIAGMPDLNFTEDIIKKTLILQKPSDSKDIMKIIYSDIVLSKKWDNTYDNCWKLMILIGKKNNLDRYRGWFKFAPDSVKDEFNSKGTLNYDLIKTENNNTNTQKSNNLTNKSGFNHLNLKLSDIPNWNMFKLTYNDANKLLDFLNIIFPYHRNNFQEVTYSLYKLNLILNKKYIATFTQIFQYYKDIKLVEILKKIESEQ